MSSRLNKTVDGWLQRNFSNADVFSGSAMLGSAVNIFRLYVLPMILLISAGVVAVMWYQKDQLHLVRISDRIGYPLLLAVTTVGALILKLRPSRIRLVMVVVVITFITHLLVAYYTEMVNRIITGHGSNYEFIILALWLPFGYVASFVFLPPQVAIRTSFVTYVAIALPQCVLLSVETDIVARQAAIAILVSQPLYIAALWGVGLLKTHTRDIHQNAKILNEAATVDALTGVANRRAIDHILTSLTKRLLINGRSMSVLMFDVDHFKKINDTYGHNIGDEVLTRLATEADSHLRTSDLIGRWGGEEFMIISLDQTDQQVLRMAERLRSELASVVYPHVGKVTVSIGVTKYLPGEDSESFINRADQALYKAKHNGRNRVEGLFD